MPEGLEIPADKLQLRLDFYSESIVLTEYKAEARATVRLVSADAIAGALARDLTFSSGLLPPDVLWWQSGRQGSQVALWRPSKIWRVALKEDPFKPARRFRLPMPGLIFLCAPQRPPAIYALRRRPQTPDDRIYQAPTFNTFSGGGTCQGTHKYGEVVSGIPEEFFASYFTSAGDARGRSLAHPRSLLELWEELDGQKEYPLDDLVQQGTVADLMHGKGGTLWH